MRYRSMTLIFCSLLFYICLQVPADAASLRYGDILIANGTGANVIRVDPLSGEQEVFSSSDEYVRPLGITVT